MKSAKQRQAEAKLRAAIQAVEQLMPPGMGIAVLVFEHNTDKGNIGYIANARREDMRRALTEFLGKWDADAAGAPFMPLTLDAFEAWVKEQDVDGAAEMLDALDRYRQASNAGPTNTTEVSHQ